MTPPEIAQLITAGAAMVAALGGLMVSLRNGQKIRTVETKQDEQHSATNSRLDQLLQVTAKLQRAEGHAEGLAAGRAESRK